MKCKALERANGLDSVLYKTYIYIFEALVLTRSLVMFLQTQMQIESALTQDPTVYEYDSVYDDLHPKEQKKVTKPEDRKVSFY